MPTLYDAKFVQERLGYKFQDPDILLLSLNAAGKGGTENEEERRGNSRLAHLGNFLMQFLLAWIGFSNDWSRADTTTLRTRLSDNSHCARVVEKAELDRCIRYDMRSGSKSAVVFRKALNAIIAAVFSDSRDLNKVLRVVLKLGLFGHDEFGMDPKLLSNDEYGFIESFCNIAAPTATIQDLDSGFPGGGPGHIQIEPNCEAPDLNIHPASDILTNMPSPSMNLFDLFLGNCSLRGEEIIDGAYDFVHVAGCQPDSKGQDDSIITRTPGRRKARKIGDTAWLSSYLVEERQRCISHNIPPPDTTFFAEHTERELRALGAKHANTSTLIHVLIASPYAIASLRELVISYQSKDSSHLWHLEPAVSPPVRFDIIKSLDDKITAYGILRRYHILRLFEDSVPPNSRVLTNIINTNPGDSRGTKRRGNPGNNDKADITSGMMRAIYPSLDPSSPEYKSCHRTVSKLQILGRRFHTLVDRFQGGILGLIPPRGGLTRTIDIGISDNMILDLPDATFNSLVDILDRTQGPFLRKSSEMALRLIEPLTSSSAQLPGPFRIEMYAPEDIIQYPKGSEQLFELFSKVYTGIFLDDGRLSLTFPSAT